MKINTISQKYIVSFSECNYFGYMKLQACLRLFENARFLVSEKADIQDFFMKLHRSKYAEISHINSEDEFFTMPVIENVISCHAQIRIGEKIKVHTWLEEPIGSYCTFHHYITSDDNKKVFISCQTKIVLLGEKSGLKINLPNVLNERILDFIRNMKSYDQIEVDDGI